MLKTVETNRLRLRERTMEDMESCIEMDRDPEVVKYVPEIANLVTEPSANQEEHRKFVKERIETEYPKGMGYWIIEAKGENKDFIGWIMLIPIDTVGPKIEIGWRLKRKYWGKGYATEAAHAILRYAFDILEITEVVADIHQLNKGSMRVAEKIGLHNKDPLKNNNYIRYSTCKN
ncbi:GNAT family N-acetyltransferase [Salibacterium aidingense]|uniref:GNAT family N-acetyltransferase n=1 Tax=Salibacterium aidingense TaxID=384933 RepID=UPI0003F8D732|nr:GNAT family N-acetyltransferase [Salibacterium aidingense]